jgi:pimeloyl-ACP methyl ester carboxylesterase
MQQNVLNGVYIARWGESGPRVIMIHGGAQGTSSAGHKNFRKQERLGSEGWQLSVPDRPGHGESADPGRPDDADADSIWTAELLGDGAHLVGHSFGGLVALFAAGLRPEAVRSLLLIEPALHKVAAHRPAVRKMLMSMVATLVLPYRPETKALRIMKLLGIPEEFAAGKDDLSQLGRGLNRLKLPPKKMMKDHLALVKAHNIPLLVVSAGSNAAFVEAGETAASLGGGTHIIVPAPHHFPQWNGEAFNAAATDLWTRADAR